MHYAICSSPLSWRIFISQTWAECIFIFILGSLFAFLFRKINLWFHTTGSLLAFSSDIWLPKKGIVSISTTRTEICNQLLIQIWKCRIYSMKMHSWFCSCCYVVIVWMKICLNVSLSTVPWCISSKFIHAPLREKNAR